MPEIFINGRVGPGRQRPDRDAGGARQRLLHPLLLLAPQLSVAGTAASASSSSKASSWVEIACNMPVSRGPARAHRLRAGARAPQDRRCSSCAQPPGRLRHLRQGRRVHAAGLPLRSTTASRRYRATPRSTLTKYYDAVRADRARQRALHPVLALRALHARDLEVERRSASRTAATIRSCARPTTARSSAIPTPTTWSTSARSARCCRSRSSTRRGSGTSRPTPSICPGCARGCTVDIWHRKPEWKLHTLDPRQNDRIERVTPRENPAVNGPWICNKGRDLAQASSSGRARTCRCRRASRSRWRPRSRRRGADRRRPHAGGAGIELGLQRGARRVPATRLGARFTTFVKHDCRPQPGELARGRPADPRRQEPERRHRTRALRRRRRSALRRRAPTSCSSGARASTSRGLPRGAKMIFLNSYLQPENGHADVFLPISVQTERARPLHEFRGRGRAHSSRASPRGRRSPMPRRCSPRWRRRPEAPRMTQDLVIDVVFIGYALAVLLAFGTVLTWVERKQAAIMADRIGANRAYVRIPFTQIKLVWLGLFHGIADGLKMMLKEDFRPEVLRQVRLRDRAVGRVRAGAAGVRGHPLRRHARCRGVLESCRRWPRWFGDRTLSAADRAARRGAARRLRLRRTDHHRRDARRLVVVQQVLAAGRAARRLADDLLRAHHGPHGARAHRRSTARSTSTHRRAGSPGIALRLPAGVGNLLPAVRGDPLPRPRRIAENKRIPFDLPEAESELIAGYFTEYSAMKMGLFMFAEFIEIAIIGALFTTLFLGGYNLPYMTDDGFVLPGRPRGDAEPRRGAS